MLTGKGLAEYAISKLGTPYFYGAKMQVLSEPFMEYMHRAYPSVVTSSYMQRARVKKMVGKICCDCSGLIGAYRKNHIGSAQLYSTAKKRLKIEDWGSFAVGTVLWKNGHVGVYIGNGYVVEEKGINYGCIKSKITDTDWKYGLTFSDMAYEYPKKVDGTEKSCNPYEEPEILVTSSANASKKGIKNYTCKGEAVKWVQFELREAGFAEQIDGSGGIDGECGFATTLCITEFQKSCKIVADGICGKETRKMLRER